MPANLPASRTDRLSSQVAPEAATFSEIALTRPGRSSPTKVSTSGVVMDRPPWRRSGLARLPYARNWRLRSLKSRRLGSENEPAQVGVAGEVADVAFDELGVDPDFLA